jgi:hypothetical protein
MPLAAVYGLNYAAGRLYDATLGPWIRQKTQATLKQKKTDPYIPPNTPGFLARDLAYQGLSFVVVDKSFQWLTSRGSVGAAAAKGAAATAGSNVLATSAVAAKNAVKTSTTLKQLVGANGFTAVNASAAAAIGPAATAAAFRALAGRTLVIAGLVSALDAGYAATIGPKLEEMVNLPFGIKKSANTDKIRGGVPLNTVKQTFEQASRQFGRTFTSALTYTVIWKELGSVVARAIALRMGGPMGGVVGALAGTVATSAVNHAVISAVGDEVSTLFQQGARAGKRVLGKELDQTAPRDVVSTMGDRVSSSVKGVLIPMTTAFGSGHKQMFFDSVSAR